MVNREQEFEKLESALRAAGKGIVFPTTPALAARVRGELQAAAAPRRLAPRRWALTVAAALAVALGLLLLFPETRDAVAQFLGLPSVRIIPVTPTPTASAGPSAAPSESATAAPMPTRAVPLANQCCQTTLADARSRSRFKIMLPPGETPSQVFLQQIPDFGTGAEQLILVFGDPLHPRWTLFQATDFLYAKLVSGGTTIEETSVNGQRALWLSGAPHVLISTDSSGRKQFGIERPVTQNTLAWEAGAVTFRLETDASKDEAIRFAESLR